MQADFENAGRITFYLDREDLEALSDYLFDALEDEVATGPDGPHCILETTVNKVVEQLIEDGWGADSPAFPKLNGAFPRWATVFEAAAKTLRDAEVRRVRAFEELYEDKED